MATKNKINDDWDGYDGVTVTMRAKGNELPWLNILTLKQHISTYSRPTWS